MSLQGEHMELFEHRVTESSLCKGLLLVFLIMALLPVTSFSQEQYIEEIVVNFRIPRMLNQDIFVLYDGRDIYLPLVDVFTLLGINVEPDFQNGRVSGEFLQRGEDYQIDLTSSQASCFGKTHELDSTTYISRETELYLQIDLFDRIFNLSIRFEFSELAIFLRHNEAFPAYQRLRRRLAQEKLRKDQAEITSVKDLPYQREYMKGAVADWRLSATASKEHRSYHYGLGVGAMLLGGDMSLSMSGNTKALPNSQQLNYRWHYYVKDNPYLTQADVGNVFMQGSFSRTLQGVKFTNKPIQNRSHFQTVEITDYVGEGWEAELYVNNRLVDFTNTSQSGVYTFLLDVQYGVSSIQVKLYGPNGELETREQFIQVPFNLVPKGVAEYSVAAGNGRYSEADTRYVQGNGYYGLLSNLSIGLNAELPLGSSDSTGGNTAVEMSYQPRGDLVLNSSYSPGYAVNGGFSFSRPSVITLNGTFIKYFENELRNPAGRLQSVTFGASAPLKIRNRHVGLRYHVRYTGYETRSDLSMSYGVSGSFSKVFLNYFGNYRLNKYSSSSNSDLSSRLFGTTRFFNFALPQFTLEYNHSHNELAKYGISVSKRMFRTGRLTLSYEHNTMSNSNQISLTFKLFNDFATFNTRGTYSQGNYSINQMQSGSVTYDEEGGTLLFSRRNAVGLGTAVVRPFLDDNLNGEYDDGEQHLSDLRARIRGAGGRRHGKERLYYYDRLRPYNEYTVQIDENSLDNPLLKPTHENFSITVNPNMVTAIDVPMVMGGEVSGFVQRLRGEDVIGVGGIRVVFVNLTNESVTTMTTFTNGEFYHLGLLPGDYRAYVDSKQLSAYRYKSEPEAIELTVKPIDGGEAVEELSFLLVPIEEAEE